MASQCLSDLNDRGRPQRVRQACPSAKLTTTSWKSARRDSEYLSNVPENTRSSKSRRVRGTKLPRSVAAGTSRVVFIKLNRLMSALTTISWLDLVLIRVPGRKLHPGDETSRGLDFYLSYMRSNYPTNDTAFGRSRLGNLILVAFGCVGLPLMSRLSAHQHCGSVGRRKHGLSKWSVWRITQYKGLYIHAKWFQ